MKMLRKGCRKNGHSHSSLTVGIWDASPHGTAAGVSDSPRTPLGSVHMLFTLVAMVLGAQGLLASLDTQGSRGEVGYH